VIEIAEGRFPGRHLVQETAETVDIGPAVQVFPLDLLGAHVMGGADEHPCLGKSCVVYCLGDAKIHHDRLTLFVDEDVLRLDVTMHHSPLMGVLEGETHLYPEPCGHLRVERSALKDELGERNTLDVRHGVVGESALAVDIMNLYDIGMREVRGDLRLAEKPEGEVFIERQLLREELQRDQTLEAVILREKHDSHPPAAELTDYLVAIRNRLPEALDI